MQNTENYLIQVYNKNLQITIEITMSIKEHFHLFQIQM
jgi:hypothetical protein